MREGERDTIRWGSHDGDALLRAKVRLSIKNCGERVALDPDF